MSDVLDYVTKDIIRTGVVHCEGIISLPELYPSEKPISIKITSNGKKFSVSDGGAGYSEVDSIAEGAIYNEVVKQVAKSQGFNCDGNMIVATGISKKFLPNAVIFVAAASRKCVEMTRAKQKGYVVSS